MLELNGKDAMDKKEVFELMDIPTEEKQIDVPIGELFSDKYFPSTVRLIISWFSVCFIYYAVMILLPTILEGLRGNNESQNFNYFFLVSISLI